MRTQSLLSAVRFVAGFGLSGSLLLAQPVPKSVPPANASLRPVVVSDSAQPAPPTYAMTLKWSDRSTTPLTVPLKNAASKPLKVQGVQATRGIFITDFPRTVPPKSEAAISFVYYAADNSDGDTDLIRVLTDDGIKEVVLKITREDAVQFDVKELRWSVGGAADTKTATITVTPGTAVPQKLRASGGNSAVLETVNATTWKVKVTPASTAKSGQFAVFVDFDKGLPGKAPVILGIIQPKE